MNESIKSIFEKLNLQNFRVVIDPKSSSDFIIELPKKNLEIKLNSFNSNDQFYNYKIINTCKEIIDFKAKIIQELNSINFCDNDAQSVFRVSNFIRLSGDKSFLMLSFNQINKVKPKVKFLNETMISLNFDVLFDGDKIIYLYKNIWFEEFEGVLVYFFKYAIKNLIQDFEIKYTKEFLNIVRLVSY